MNREVQNWVECAHYDLQTARDLLGAGRYLYVVFMCHLAVEKALKAHVANVTGEVPPRTHDLIYLLEQAQLEVPPAHLEFIGKVNLASVPTWYPNDLRRALSDWSEALAREYFERSREIVEWLTEHPNLSR